MKVRAAFLTLLLAAGGTLAQTGPAPAAAPAASAAASAPAAAAPADLQQFRTLQEALGLLRARRPHQAILALDEVIDFYATRQRNTPQKVYCARNATEAKHYLDRHARETPGQAALVVRNWCDALYLKGFALVELGQLPEARKAVEGAIALSPANAQYHAELGAIYSVEKNWNAALGSYRAAEAATQYSEDSRNFMLARIHRETGMVLAQMERFDEAEQRYRRSLEIEPDSELAKQQLETLRQRKPGD